MTSQTYSSNIRDILVCPYCSHPDLRSENEGVVCTNCHTVYDMPRVGQLDFRLKEQKKYRIDFEVGTPFLNEGQLECKPLSFNPSVEVDYSKLTVPRHLSKEILSYFPRARHDNSLMLDLGCCDTVHREVSEHAGFEYVGIDYDAEKAPILGDAHALPFRDNSFDFVLSVAVLQQIRFPFIMAHEVHRVLKPGGKFIGTVAFLEPFAGQCYYHHTHLGVYNTLLSGPLKAQQIAPSKD